MFLCSCTCHMSVSKTDICINLSFVCHVCFLCLTFAHPSVSLPFTAGGLHSLPSPRHSPRSVTARPHVDLVRFRIARLHRRQNNSSSPDDSADTSASASGSASGGHKRSTRLGDLPTYAVQVTDIIPQDFDFSKDATSPCAIQLKFVCTWPPYFVSIFRFMAPRTDIGARGHEFGHGAAAAA